ncbi:MAG TPA: trehalase family glycosidase, partial [Terriglobus sp.]
KQYLVPASAGDKASCNKSQSKVCAAAEVKGMRLSRDFYKGDRAMRESGFDTSFRFGAFSGSTHHFAPVCLNSLLYKYEIDMAALANELGRTEESNTWTQYAATRKAAINKYLWDEQQGGFYDYDFIAAKRSHYTYATAFYPLWAGIATPKQQAATISTVLPKLLLPHGLAMSDRPTGMQWDLPFSWAPTVYFAAIGLQSTGHNEAASAIANRYINTVQANYTREGTLREKYNAETGTTETNLAAGYRSNNAGFGWTNGVYLRLLSLESSEVRPKQ